MNRIQVFRPSSDPLGPASQVLRLLEQHVPHSLPLLRRLQFARFPGGVTEHARVLLAVEESLDGGGETVVSTTAADGKGEEGKGAVKSMGKTTTPSFAAAYVDFSRGPETEVWMYSSLEARGLEQQQQQQQDPSSPLPQRARNGAEGEDEDEDARKARLEAGLAIAVLREIKAQRDGYDVNPDALPRRSRTEVLMGTLSEKLRLALVDASIALGGGGGGGAPAAASTITFPYVELYDKWLMRLDTLPDMPGSALAMLSPEAGGHGGDVVDEDESLLHWTQVRREDIAMVLSKTSIPRKERTIILLPSMALAKKDGTLVAWAFLGPDSSLTSLHCEPEYRGRGLAKAVAIKILKDHLGRFGDDGYCWADVALNNKASQGVCKSLGARAAWQHSWSLIDLDKSFPNI